MVSLLEFKNENRYRNNLTKNNIIIIYIMYIAVPIYYIYNGISNISLDKKP